LAWQPEELNVVVGIDKFDFLVFSAGAILGGDADGDVVGRYVFGDDGIRTNSGAFPDDDRSKYLGTGSDGDIILDGGVALGLGEDLPTEGDSVIEHNPFANFCGLSDDYAHAMVYKEAAADSCPRVNLDSGEKAVELG